MTTSPEGFYFRGVERLSFGFENPNEAAFILAVVSVALSYVGFSAPRLTILKYVLAGAELLALYLLSVTLSRSGLCASVVGYAVLYCPSTFSRQTILLGLKRIGVRLLLLVLLSLSTQMSVRIEYALEGRDPSVGNRFAVWKDAIPLLRAAPISGWGLGSSGWHYVNWVQPPERNEGYKSLISTPLTIAVEHGIPMAALAIAGAIAAVAASIVLSRHTQCGQLRLSAAILAALLAYSTANTVLNSISTAAVLAAAATIAATAVPKLWHSARLVLLRVICRSVVVVFVLTFISVIAAAWLWSQPVHLRFGRGIVRITAASESSSRNMVLLPETATLGERYGKRLRTVGAKISLTVVMADGDLSSLKIEPGSRIVAFGERVHDLTRLQVPAEVEIVAVNPALSWFANRTSVPLTTAILGQTSTQARISASLRQVQLEDTEVIIWPWMGDYITNHLLRHLVFGSFSG